MFWVTLSIRLPLLVLWLVSVDLLRDRVCSEFSADVLWFDAWSQVGHLSETVKGGGQVG